MTKRESKTLKRPTKLCMCRETIDIVNYCFCLELIFVIIIIFLIKNIMFICGYIEKNIHHKLFLQICLGFVVEIGETVIEITCNIFTLIVNFP